MAAAETFLLLKHCLPRLVLVNNPHLLHYGGWVPNFLRWQRHEAWLEVLNGDWVGYLGLVPNTTSLVRNGFRLLARWDPFFDAT